MTLYVFISTPSFSASFFAADDGRTLKPTIIPFSAVDASMTSFSDIWPTAPWITFTSTFSVESLMNESVSASTEPWVSAFTMRFSMWNSPRAMRWAISSSDSVFVVRRLCSRCSCIRFDAISRASCSVSMIWKESPADGAPLRPRMITGSEGPACCTRWLRSLNIALIRP